MQSTEQQAQALVEELQDQAREHKKMERRSRDLAQRTYATLGELEAFCRAAGIPVVRERREVRRG